MKTEATTATTETLLTAVKAAHSQADAIFEAGRFATREMHLTLSDEFDRIVTAAAECLMEARTSARLRKLLVAILAFVNERGQFHTALALHPDILCVREWEEVLFPGILPRFREVLSALEQFGRPEPTLVPLETPAELKAEGVNEQCIASIYSHNSSGPFHVNGQPNVELVRRELSTPGSVLKAGEWKDPRELAREQQATEDCRAIMRLRLEAAAAAQRLADVETRGHLQLV